MSIAKVAAARVTIHISYIQSFIVVWLIVPKLQKQNIGESGERCPGFCYVIYYSKMTIGKQKLGVSTEADIIFLQKYHTFVPEI